jgi:hypothetical protein
MTDHETMASKGWSWIELLGGPEDGRMTYFKGTPAWALAFVDSSVNPKDYKPGDLEHKYELTCGDDGRAIYRYIGELIRKEEGNA